MYRLYRTVLYPILPAPTISIQDKEAVTLDILTVGNTLYDWDVWGVSVKTMVINRLDNKDV